MTTDFSKLPNDIIVHINSFISPLTRSYILFVKYGNICDYLKKYLKDKKTLSLLLFHFASHNKCSKIKDGMYTTIPRSPSSVTYKMITLIDNNIVMNGDDVKYLQRLVYCIETIIKRKYGKSIYTDKFDWISGFEREFWKKSEWIYPHHYVFTEDEIIPKLHINIRRLENENKKIKELIRLKNEEC